MSRVSAPHSTQSGTKMVQIPHEKIAMRAYEKWCKRGCLHGSDLKDWVEAESELRSELARTPATSMRR